MPASIDAQESVTDAALMRAYGGGDARAFETLYARHKAATYRYFLRHLLGHTATADELHQDLWLKVIGARERYETQARFTTWLYTLARHRLIDHWRANNGIALTELDDEDAPDSIDGPDTLAPTGTLAQSPVHDRLADPLHASIDDESRRRLLSALADVPPLQRDAFLLHIEGGQSLDAIATLTLASVETVKSRLRYAYRRLRAALEDTQ